MNLKNCFSSYSRYDILQQFCLMKTSFQWKSPSKQEFYYELCFVIFLKKAKTLGAFQAGFCIRHSFSMLGTFKFTPKIGRFSLCLSTRRHEIMCFLVCSADAHA